jgi:uncharacterized protein (DUF1778 family)
LPAGCLAQRDATVYGDTAGIFFCKEISRQSKIFAYDKCGKFVKSGICPTGMPAWAIKGRRSAMETPEKAESQKNVDASAFIRQQAVAGAEAIVLEHQRFVLTSEHWKTLHDVFERPTKVLANLSQIMAEPDEWE